MGTTKVSGGAVQDDALTFFFRTGIAQVVTATPTILDLRAEDEAIAQPDRTVWYAPVTGTIESSDSGARFIWHLALEYEQHALNIFPKDVACRILLPALLDEGGNGAKPYQAAQRHTDVGRVEFGKKQFTGDNWIATAPQLEIYCVGGLGCAIKITQIELAIYDDR